MWDVYCATRSTLLFPELPRPRRRLTELMVKTALKRPQTEDESANKRQWELHFLRSPVEFLPDDSGKRLGSVKLAVNTLKVLSFYHLVLGLL